MIKPRHWPWTEFLSSRGQESQHLSQLSNNLSITHQRQNIHDTCQEDHPACCFSPPLAHASLFCSTTQQISVVHPWSMVLGHSREAHKVLHLWADVLSPNKNSFLSSHLSLTWLTISLFSEILHFLRWGQSVQPLSLYTSAVGEFAWAHSLFLHSLIPVL